MSIPATLDTALYRRLVLELLNDLVANGGGGGGATSTNSAVGPDGVTRVPLNVNADGELKVNVEASINADLTLIENKLDTIIGIETPQAADVATIKNKLNSGISTTLGSGVSLASGQSLTSARSWNLAFGTDSLTASISSIPAVSLASGQSVSLSGGTVTLGGAVSLASGQSLASAGYVSIPAAFVTGQSKIAVTGTAVQLGSNALTQGVLISALSTNTASITIGTSSSVTNVVNGTGNGAILTAGSTKSIAATNTNLIWINGTAGDIISFIGS
jgi:hypothetical protein